MLLLGVWGLQHLQSLYSARITTRMRLLMCALNAALFWFTHQSIRRKSSVQTSAEPYGGIRIWTKSTGRHTTKLSAKTVERSSGVMAMTTGCSVQESASMNTENRAMSDSRSVECLSEYYIVMSFADRMLEKQIISPSEYAAFAVETAQSCGLKMPPNSCNPMR